MNEFIKAFKEGEQEGRADTGQALSDIRSGGVPSPDYFTKIAKRVMFLGFIIGVGAFFYFLFHHTNILLSLLFGFIAYMIGAFVLALISVAVLKLASKKAS